jgi:proline racemase
MARHTFFCVDALAFVNPVRVFVGCCPFLPNVPMADQRQIFVRDHDWIRKALMFEPRGHDVMSGTILYPPSREDCDIGVLFIEVSGCLAMCGHATIGTVTAALEEGLVAPREEGRLAIEAPAGRSRSNTRATTSTLIRFVCSTSRATCTQPTSLDIPGLGTLIVDLSMAASTSSSSHKPTGRG